MAEEWCPPQHAIDEWRKACDCCPVCGVCPCDGIAAGGMCDDIACHCNHGYDDDPDWDEDEDEEDVAAYFARNWFRVEVTDHEGLVVAIELGALTGRDIGEKEKKVIVQAIRHLSGFIGNNLDLDD